MSKRLLSLSLVFSLISSSLFASENKITAQRLHALDRKITERSQSFFSGSVRTNAYRVVGITALGSLGTYVYTKVKAASLQAKVNLLLADVNAYSAFIKSGGYQAIAIPGNEAFLEALGDYTYKVLQSKRGLGLYRSLSYQQKIAFSQLEANATQLGSLLEKKQMSMIGFDVQGVSRKINHGASYGSAVSIEQSKMLLDESVSMAKSELLKGVLADPKKQRIYVELVLNEKSLLEDAVIDGVRRMDLAVTEATAKNSKLIQSSLPLNARVVRNQKIQTGAKIGGIVSLGLFALLEIASNQESVKAFFESRLSFHEVVQSNLEKVLAINLTSPYAAKIVENDDERRAQFLAMETASEELNAMDKDALLQMSKKAKQSQ
jgi:hypothetical protein